MKLVNLTPHVLNIISVDGSTVNVPTSGTVARVSSTAQSVGTVAGIAVTKSVFGDVIDLPAAQDGVVLIVSRMVKDRVANRDDVMVPGA
ncbi:hypothetical protein EOM81_11890, partial [bacterium]|nr:hypothetical protein [bacterium]